MPTRSRSENPINRTPRTGAFTYLPETSGKHETISAITYQHSIYTKFDTNDCISTS